MKYSEHIDYLVKKALMDEAREVRKKAYAPYSHFQVGAALLGEHGDIYTGCNVENASYGASNCAERTAVFKAVSEGERKFAAIAIVGEKEGEETGFPCPPCGICRQVLREFVDPKTFRVILEDGNGGWEERTLEEILPESFGPDNL